MSAGLYQGNMKAINGSKKEEYLGDGLYVSYDGYMYALRAPRDYGDHIVYLEPEVLKRFIEFARQKNPLITSVLIDKSK